MEGVSFSLRDSFAILEAMKIEPELMTVTGGGGRSPLWRQMLADNFNCPVQTIDAKEGPALGVAILAGVGAGLFKSVAEGCDALIRPGEIQTPIAENVAVYNRIYPLYRRLYDDLKTSFKSLARL